MALSKVTVKRAVQADGNDFLTLADGSSRLAQAVVPVDADGNAIAYGANYSSAAKEDSKILSVAAGAIGEVHTYLDGFSGTAVTVMLFNATSLPINGTAPDWRIPLTAGIGSYWFPTGFSYTAGLVIAFSSTHATLTVTTGSEGYIHTRSN